MSKEKSNIQEKRVASEIGGKVTIASGALYFQKADVRGTTFLIECKTTDKFFYTLKESIWNKICKESLKDNLRIPLLQVDINNTTSLVIINFLDFYGLGLDLDSTFIGNTEPILVYKKSFSICLDFLNNIVNTDTTYYHLQQIKFVNSNTHLMILSWDDFLHLCSKKGVKI